VGNIVDQLSISSAILTAALMSAAASAPDSSAVQPASAACIIATQVLVMGAIVVTGLELFGVGAGQQHQNGSASTALDVQSSAAATDHRRRRGAAAASELGTVRSEGGVEDDDDDNDVRAAAAAPPAVQSQRDLEVALLKMQLEEKNGLLDEQQREIFQLRQRNEELQAKLLTSREQ
jgi:hypothetical protein